MTLCLDLTSDDAGHPFQMADSAEIEVPHDWIAMSAWHGNSISARMLRDMEARGGSESEPGNPVGTKGQGHWAMCATTNTRAVGTLVTVELRKSTSGGLGFSITTRDNVEGPNSPVYIKHILPGGAAIKDGRLRPGDRLLQVNDVMTTGKCLSDVTAILRNTEIDALTRIVISRQTVAQSRTKASPEFVIDKEDCSGDVDSREDALFGLHSASESGTRSSVSQTNPIDRTETLRLRVVPDGSAAMNQLGLRVKRSKRTNLFGLHVRSVIEGGLADKDGQLQANDYLVKVNGISLANVNRSTAVDIFRSALQRSYENLSAIDIVVIRWKVPESSPPSNLEVTVCEEKSECLSVRPILENAESDQRIISFSKATVETGAVEDFSVHCLSLVDRGVSSTGAHSRDFDHPFCMERKTLDFREMQEGKLDDRERISEEDIRGKICEGSIKCRLPDDNFTSATSSSESMDAVVQDKDAVDSRVFERQGFGRKSISEKRSSRELLSDSEVYRNIKENRKCKDLIKPAETNAEFHEMTDGNGKELEFGERLQHLRPAALGSNPQGSFPDGSDPQGSLPSISTPLGSVPFGPPLGCLPNESTPRRSPPVQSLKSILIRSSPTSSIPLGSASQRSNPQGSAGNESILLGSALRGSIQRGSVPLRSVPLPSVPQESVPHRSIQQGPVPPESVSLGSIPHGFIRHESDQRGSVQHVSVPHGSVPLGHVPPGSIPLVSTPDGVLSACTSRNIHIKQSTTDLSTVTAVIGKNDSAVPLNSSSLTSSQIPSGTSSAALSSSEKPSKKFTASLIRRFFKKGFADLFGSEAQTGSPQQFDGDKNEGVVKHIPPNNPIRKDSSLPRLRSDHIDTDVSACPSHPDLRQSYPNALLTVPPNFCHPGQFPCHPARFQVPQSCARNSLPVQFFRPNPYPLSTVLVRSHVSPIPSSFAPYPTYVPLDRTVFQACPIQRNRLPGPVVCPTQLWGRFRQKFMNIQHMTSQESRMLNQ